MLGREAAVAAAIAAAVTAAYIIIFLNSCGGFCPYTISGSSSKMPPAPASSDPHLFILILEILNSKRCHCKILC